MLETGARRRIEHLYRAVRHVIDERRITDQRLAIAPQLQHIGQLAEFPIDYSIVQFVGRRLAPDDLLKRFAHLSTELRAQLREVPPHCKLPAVLVDYFEVHLQMRRQRFALEIGGLTNEGPPVSNI